jgi:hypothetical protein
MKKPGESRASFLCGGKAAWRLLYCGRHSRESGNSFFVLAVADAGREQDQDGFAL